MGRTIASQPPCSTAAWSGTSLKIRWTRSTHSLDGGRAFIIAAATATMLIAASLVASGCGRGAPAQTDPPLPLTGVQAQATTDYVLASNGPTATPDGGSAYGTSIAGGSVAAGYQSLHERVMAEQGRGPGGAAVRARTTTTAGSGQPAGTTPVASAAPAASAASADMPRQPGGSTEVLTSGQTPLRGAWAGTADQLASYLLSVNSSPRFTVSALTLAQYYVRYCAEAGLRADLLWAQMIVETGCGMYDGDVTPQQNNFAGIGATGGGAPGITFGTAEAGVMAHVAHMVAYVYDSSPVAWANSATDPRFDMVSPRGAAVVLSDLDGRWAVPGNGYGENIETVARAINGG